MPRWLKYLIELSGIVALMFLIPATFYHFRGTAGLKIFGKLSVLFLAIAGALHFFWWPPLMRLLEKIGVVSAPEAGTAQVVMLNKTPWCILDADGSHPANKASNAFMPFRKGMNKILASGLYWVGIFLFSLYLYKFRWTVLRDSEPKEGEPGVVDSRQISTGQWAVTREEVMNHINLKPSSYYGEVIGAQTKEENMKVNALYTILVQIVDPELALFGGEAFLTITHTLVKASIRARIAGAKFQNLLDRKELDGAQDEILNVDVRSLKFPRGQAPQGTANPTAGSTLKLAEYLQVMFGVRILQLTFEAIEPPEAYATASEQLAAAKQQAATRIALAEAEKKAVTLVGEGNAAAIEAEIAAVQKGGDIGLEVLRARAFTDAAGSKGNMVITGYPGSTAGGMPPVIIQPQQPQQPQPVGAGGGKKKDKEGQS